MKKPKSKRRATLAFLHLKTIYEIAFYSQEVLERILCTTVENIESFAAGKPMNLVE